MSSTNLLYSNPQPCQHLADYKLKYGFNGYNSFHKCLKVKTQIPRCSFCNGFQSRLFSCLICSSISCSDHTLLHTQSQIGHHIAVDIERAELYCCVCCDQVYDPGFDRVVVYKHVKEMPGADLIRARSGKRRRRLVPGMELDLLNPGQLVSGSGRDERAKSCYPLGLRGLNNLGSTCFMNSVLQALVHAPPFRNYFLSHHHSHKTCTKRSSHQPCLSCDIDVIFSAVFSGERFPYSPAQFLYSWWQHSATLANYEQQDAHEFFMSVLDLIHEGKAKHPNEDNVDCLCVAHRVFSGLLRSDVTCMTCGFTSTTYEPCVDISLNLDMSRCSLTDTAANKSTEPSQVYTLWGCLDFFTRREKLGSDQKLHCQSCQERRDSTKQMSISKLPLVLSLHVKRFEHSLARNKSRKIDQYLQFPFSLDMSPYLTSSVVRSRYGNRIFACEGDMSAEFEIFAVISHSGKLESGHYVSYVRVGEQWYKCDDAWINEVDEEVVRASQCYMMFYVQKAFSHRSKDELSSLSMPWRHHVAGCC